MTAPMEVPTAAPPHWTGRGSPEYRRILAALFLSGYATFSLLYCVQPLLPLFSAHFQLDAARSALSLSLTTGLLAPSILLAGVVSEQIGRKALMAASLGLAALFDLLAAGAPNWTVLLVLRALEGIALGGAPAIAMTYLAEEIHPTSLGLAMGLYVGGTALGGMAGRLLTGVAAQLLGWRGALATIGVLGAVSALAFLLLLPASRNFRKQPGFDPRGFFDAWTGHLRNPGLRALFAIGGLLMGSFVTLFNAVTYRLLAPPYRLNQAEVGTIFVIYLLGTAASTLAGGLTGRIGRTPVLAAALCASLLGLLLTMLSPLAFVIAGLAVITVGFFAGHAVASGGVGHLARGGKAQAASLYLLSYYLGSSLLSLIGGLLWEQGGWQAVAGFCAGLLLLCLWLALKAGLALQAGRALPLALLLVGMAASSASARAIPSPFLQQMIRSEAPSPSPPPAGMGILSALRIGGRPVRLGATPIGAVAHRLGVALDYQHDAGDSITWFCVRLDAKRSRRHPARGPSLWVVSDAESVDTPHAINAVAVDALGSEARRCATPQHPVDLELDRHIARPGDAAGTVARLYGHAPVRAGRSAYGLPGMQPDPVPLVLTLSMRNTHVEAIWLAATPDN